MVGNFVLAYLDRKRTGLRGWVVRCLRGELQDFSWDRLKREVAVQRESAAKNHARKHEKNVEGPFPHEQGVAGEMAGAVQRSAHGLAGHCAGARLV